jgi:hypothetical protein
MGVERLHPIGDKQVVREIIPGGHDERELRLYPDEESLQSARRMERNPLVPKFVSGLLDNSVTVDSDFLNIDPVSRDDRAAENEVYYAA